MVYRKEEFPSYEEHPSPCQRTIYESLYHLHLNSILFNFLEYCLPPFRFPYLFVRSETNKCFTRLLAFLRNIGIEKQIFILTYQMTWGILLCPLKSFDI